MNRLARLQFAWILLLLAAVATSPIAAQTVLVNEPFDGASLPVGFTVLGGSATVSGGYLTLGSGRLELPGSYSRATGLRIEADVNIQNGSIGDFNILALYDGAGDHPSPNGYEAGYHPIGSDNPTDFILAVTTDVPAILASTPVTITAGTWVHVSFEFLPSGVLRTSINGVETMNANSSAFTSGPLMIRSHQNVLVDNLVVTADIAAACVDPSTFSLVNPSPGQTGVSITPLLSWNASAGAGSYEVRLGTTNPPPLVTTVVGTSYTPAGNLSVSTVIYWDVTAVASCDSSRKTLNAGGVQSFTTTSNCPLPATFDLVYPPNSGTGVSQHPTLTWLPAAGAGSYEVRLGTANPPPVVETVTGTSYTPAFGLPESSVVYWSVTAIASCDAANRTTNNGGIRSFATTSSANSSISEPFDGASLPAGFTLLGGSATVSGGYLTLGSGRLELPGSFSRATGLRIEADVNIQNGSIGDFNILALYDGAGDHPSPNGYEAGYHPIGSDNPTDFILAVTADVPATLASTPVTITAGTWVHVSFELFPSGVLRTSINGVETMSVNSNAFTSGPLMIRSHQNVLVDNLVVTADIAAACVDPSAFSLVNPLPGQSGVSITPLLTWNASAGAGSYEVRLGTTNPPPLVATVSGTGYTPDFSLAANTSFYWSITARAGCDPSRKMLNSGGVRSFRTGSITSSYVSETFDGPDLPNGFVVEGGSPFVSGGYLTLNSACVRLPGTFDRSSGLRIEADINIRSGSIGDFNIWALYDGFTSCSGNPAPNGYNAGFFPFGSDNPTDQILSYLGGVPAMVGSAPTLISAGTWHRVLLEIYPDGPVTMSIDGVRRVSGVNSDHVAGPILLRSWQEVWLDNLTVSSIQGSSCVPPLSFSLVSPSAGATNVGESSAMKWTPSPDANSYDVWLGRTNPPPLVATVTGTSYTPLSVLESGATYYWYVKAKAACDPTKATANSDGIRSFATAAAKQGAKVVVIGAPAALLQTAGDGSSASGDYAIVNVGDEETTVTVMADFGGLEPFFEQSTTELTLGAGESRSIVVTSFPSGTPSVKQGSAEVNGTAVVGERRVPVTVVTSAPAGLGIPDVIAVTRRIDVSAPLGEIPRGAIVFQNMGTGNAAGVLYTDVPWIVPDNKMLTVSGNGGTATAGFSIDRAKRPDGADPSGSASGTMYLAYVAGSTGARLSPESTTGATLAVPVSDTVKPALSEAGIPFLLPGEMGLLLPGVGHVTGSEGREFISDLSIINRVRSTPVNKLTLYFTVGGRSVAAEQSLRVGQSLGLADVVSTVFGQTAQGTLQIRSSDAINLRISANVFNKSDPRGTFGTAIPVLRTSNAIEPGKELFLPGLRSDTNSYTNLYLQEMSGYAGVADVEVLNAEGQVIDRQAGIGVPAFGLQPVFRFVPEGGVAAVVKNVSAEAKIVAYATPLDKASGDTWAVTDWNLAQATAGDEGLAIPVAGALKGANQSDFRTDVALMNVGTSAASATLTYRAATGTVEKTVELPVRGSRVLTDVVRSLFEVTAEATVGWIQIAPGAGGRIAASSRVYTAGADLPGSFGTSVPTLPLRRSLRLGQSAVFAGVDDTSAATVTARRGGTYRANAALVETSGAPATVRLSIYFELPGALAGGAPKGTLTLDLSPYEYRQLNSIGKAILGASRDSIYGDIRGAQIVVEVIGGNGAVIPFITLTDNGTNDTVLRIE